MASHLQKFCRSAFVRDSKTCATQPRIIVAVHSITGSNPVHRDKDLSSALDSPTNGGSIKECDILRPFTGWLLHRWWERAFPHFEEKTALSYRWRER
nr:MAG TPA: hypothetical protein [Caudoviricetes sp.]